ncbi:MAG: hypothetical protein O7B35_12620 [Deltaproteobacteria bacterium]|nr:hypothetical protein [Deltaproteobacteria bacterium]
MIEIQTFRDALRALSQFHENEKLVARVQTWKAVTWLTPKRHKELVVEFFFFPTYLRYFRTWPKLRMSIYA